MNRMGFTVVAILIGGAALAQAGVSVSNVAKWDPRMAAENASVDTNGVKWIDGRFLPIEGRAFDDTEFYYDRLPAHVTTNVNEGVRNLKHHTSGMLFRFRTDSKTLVLKWIVRDPCAHMPHMTDIGASGLDVYRRDGSGGWSFVSSSMGYSKTGRSGERAKRIGWRPGSECIINLPLYNGIREFALGIDPDAKIEPARPHAVAKPVVFYGTSITHGGCATRPGLGFVNRVGRDLDVPVVNLGFSGSGRMEFEMSEHLAHIDASCYVLDCLWDMSSVSNSYGRVDARVENNYEPFIRNLRAKRPGVPIVMACQCDVWCGDPGRKDLYVKTLYDKLVAEGLENLVYLPKDEMYSGDTEGTVDGCHPNDLGMKSMSVAYGKAVRKSLGVEETQEPKGKERTK